MRRIGRETGRPVSDVDPREPGARAKVVMLMLSPGPARGGAQETNVLSPTTNSGQSALNLAMPELTHDRGAGADLVDPSLFAVRHLLPAPRVTNRM